MGKKKKSQFWGKNDVKEEELFLTSSSVFLLFSVGTFLFIYGLIKDKDWIWLTGVGLIIFLNIYLLF